MDTRNIPRNTTGEKTERDGDFEFYLKSGLPTNQIVAILKAQKMDQKDIDIFMSKLEASKKKVNKMLKKFVQSIEQQYGHLDIPELIKKGIKFAAKHEFSEAEKEAFIRYALKGETENNMFPIQDLGYTEMSKFLGFSSYAGQMLEIKADDQSTLNEIVKKYSETKILHASLKNQMLSYTDCAPEVLTGKFDETKHNVSLHIHPVVFALFVPKIAAIERRMLLTNYGRLVAQRAAPYIRNSFAVEPTIAHEIESDYQLAFDIAKDPNSLAYFSDEKPIANLLKRFLIQIKLWYNVINLRQGKFYSLGEYETDDGITGFVKALNSYDWTFFDSPDLSQAQDEGTILRKLLAVFSFRPSFTQLSSVITKAGLGYSNMGSLARTTFINTPIVNIRLPTNIYGRASAPVALRSALTQSDWYLDGKLLVPKNKVVIYSRDVIFFYANRKYPSVNFANISMQYNYVGIPMNYTGITTINDTALKFGPYQQIGSDRFLLKSVIVLQTVADPSGATETIASGCAAIVVRHPNMVSGDQSTSYYYYNPQGASSMRQYPDGSFKRNRPVTILTANSSDPNSPGFYDIAEKYGTIFMYVKEVPDTR
jgi:hypothetical protein